MTVHGLFLVHLNGLLECVVQIDLVQSFCDKRSLGSRWPASRIILTYKVL